MHFDLETLTFELINVDTINLDAIQIQINHYHLFLFKWINERMFQVLLIEF